MVKSYENSWIFVLCTIIILSLVFFHFFNNLEKEEIKYCQEQGYNLTAYITKEECDCAVFCDFRYYYAPGGMFRSPICQCKESLV